MTNTELLDLIETACARSGMAVTTFCKAAVNDGGVYRRLKAGRTVTLTNAERIRAFAERVVSS